MVNLVYNDWHRDHKIVTVVDRWSLFRGHLWCKTENGMVTVVGMVVAILPIQRWSLTRFAIADLISMLSSFTIKTSFYHSVIVIIKHWPKVSTLSGYISLFNKFCLKKIINLFLKFQNLFSPPLKGCTVPAPFRHAQTENIEPQKSKLNYFKLLFFNF